MSKPYTHNTPTPTPDTLRACHAENERAPYTPTPPTTVHTKDNFSDLLTKPCGKEEYALFLMVFCGYERWVIKVPRETINDIHLSLAKSC